MSSPPVQLSTKSINLSIENGFVKKLFNVEHFNQVNCKKVDGGLIFDVTIETTEICSSERINELMAQNSFIISIYRNED